MIGASVGACTSTINQQVSFIDLESKLPTVPADTGTEGLRLFLYSV